MYRDHLRRSASIRMGPSHLRPTPFQYKPRDVDRTVMLSFAQVGIRTSECANWHRSAVRLANSREPRWPERTGGVFIRDEEVAACERRRHWRMIQAGHEAMSPWVVEQRRIDLPQLFGRPVLSVLDHVRDHVQFVDIGPKALGSRIDAEHVGEPVKKMFKLPAHLASRLCRSSYTSAQKGERDRRCRAGRSTTLSTTSCFVSALKRAL